MVPESVLVLAVVAAVAASVWLLRRGGRRAARQPDMLNLGENWIASVCVETGPRWTADDVQRLLSRHHISCWGWTGDDATAIFSIPRPSIERATRLLVEAGIPIVEPGHRLEGARADLKPAVAPRHMPA